MADELTKYDEVLLTVAGQCGGIAPLLDTLFSFLYRKTDFFHVMAEGDQMGFPEGVAEKLVLRAFRKYQAASAKARAEAGLPSSPSPSPPAPLASSDGKTPASVCDSLAGATLSSEASGTAASSAAAGGDAPSSDARCSQPAPRRLASAREASAAMPHVASSRPAPNLDVYNGGRTDRYTWEQTLHDLTLAVPVPAGTRARDVVCVIKKDGLTLRLKGAAGPLVEGRFPCDARNGTEVWETVRMDECTWSVGTLSDGAPVVNVYLEKARESWWKAAIDGDEEIDTTQVDSTRSMYEYDGETQGAIRKILFDQDQKRKGMPTSDELQSEDLLRKAWDAEGSPFRGTPFDPTKVDFRRGGGVPGAP